VQTLLESGEKLFVPGNQASFKEGGLNRNIIAGFIQAFLNGSDAMPNFQSDIPEMADQFFQFFLECNSGRLGQENQ